MPLEKGTSREVIGRNIKREKAAGKEQAQAVAIALSKAREAGADIPKPKKKKKRKEETSTTVNVGAWHGAPTARVKKRLPQEFLRKRKKKLEDSAAADRVMQLVYAVENKTASLL